MKLIYSLRLYKEDELKLAFEIIMEMNDGNPDLENFSELEKIVEEIKEELDE